TGVRRAADPAPRELGELLDRLSDTALRFLAAVPRPPRNLRMRAGEVSVDIKWVGEHAAGTESAPAAPVAVPTTAPELSISYLIAQTVGVFYRAPEPGAAPFVNAGDTVVVGQQVGIIEAMKLLIPVQADRAGRIAEVLKQNGEPVEYGEPLFALGALDPT
ncbi:MAG: acetyl-CoA carboxylase biotin carboxyl carrier protein, partial [Pseudonocardiaceae bacterium]